MRIAGPRLVCVLVIALLIAGSLGSARAGVCWQREIEHVDKRTGEVTYRSRAVPCPDDRQGNREGVCWQREIERIDPKTGKVTYRNRAVPCSQIP
jgi:hypothetical protein